tara:strand:- start:4548 stop:4784 length:237 start_codon:yes stop_codon:yes gene_type:complete
MTTAQPLASIFNKHRYIALILFVIAASIIWYGVILMTNPYDVKSIPDKNQWIGLIIAIIVSLITWFGRCFTIIPDKKN